MAQFSDTTNKNGIIQQIEKLTGLGDAGITGNATLLKQITADVNNAYSRAASIIIKVDGRMQWDDSNHTNQPISQFNLVSGQKDYSIFAAAPTALQDWLQVERVEILDTNDNGVFLQPIDHQEINGAESEYKDVNATPEQYDFNGASILFYPAPNYNKTNGGKIFFKRAPSYYVSTDTTKVPGFAVLYHELLALWPAYWWGVAKGKGYIKTVRQEIVLLEADLGKFYSNRPKFERPRITRLIQKWK